MYAIRSYYEGRQVYIVHPDYCLKPELAFFVLVKRGELRISGPPMNPVLKLLIEGGSLTPAQMAQVAGLSEAEINQQLEQLKKENCL